MKIYKFNNKLPNKYIKKQPIKIQESLLKKIRKFHKIYDYFAIQ